MLELFWIDIWTRKIGTASGSVVVGVVVGRAGVGDDGCVPRLTSYWTMIGHSCAAAWRRRMTMRKRG